MNILLDAKGKENLYEYFIIYIEFHLSQNFVTQINTLSVIYTIFYTAVSFLVYF